MKFQNKVAVITGGARGIGKVTAEEFLKEGAKVAVIDVNEEAFSEIRKQWTDHENNYIAIPADVTKVDSVKQAMDKVIEKFGKIDILLCNAGITRDSMAHKMTSEQFDLVIDVNLRGVWHCVQSVIGHMRDQSSGRILFTSSVVGEYGNIGQLNYSASKGAVITMAKSLAKELGRKNITVNVVSPGYTMTEMMSTVPEKILDGIKSKTPMGRLAEPIEIAKAFLFLASEDAGYITGHNLSVNGGLTL